MSDGLARGRLGALVLSAAVFLAPFIALLYNVAAGLIVMATALAAATFLLLEAVSVAPDHARRWLRLAVAVNLGLATACALAAIWLIVGR